MRCFFFSLFFDFLAVNFISGHICNRDVFWLNKDGRYCEWQYESFVEVVVGLGACSAYEGIPFPAKCADDIV